MSVCFWCVWLFRVEILPSEAPRSLIDRLSFRPFPPQQHSLKLSRDHNGGRFCGCIRPKPHTGRQVGGAPRGSHRCGKRVIGKGKGAEGFYRRTSRGRGIYTNRDTPVLTVLSLSLSLDRFIVGTSGTGAARLFRFRVKPGFGQVRVRLESVGRTCCCCSKKNPKNPTRGLFKTLRCFRTGKNPPC